MKTKRALITFSLSLMCGLMMAQSPRLKGNGQIFWEEHFNWGNPADPKGWTAPAGWKIEDNSADDNGFVWTWTKDSLQGPMSKRDGGYILNSATRENGFLALDLDNYNAYKNYMDMLYVNSSITLPLMNFSGHPSVIVSFDQLFKYFNTPRMVMEVSNDNGAHWAEFDLKMGTARGINTQNLPNTGVAHYSVNISDVAANQSQVTIKITWSGSILYFWMIDDLTFAEGWDNDLKMNHWQVQMIDNESRVSEGFFYMLPKTQIRPVGLFEGSVTNYGDEEQTHIRLTAEILKNGVSQFSTASNTLNSRYYGDPADTLFISQSYTPVDFGHYQLTLSMQSDQVDQNPENNRKSWYFHVTDSAFARTPDVSEADESPWRDYYQYTHEGDLMGVEFNPVADCEASSLSAYISKANIGADFKFVLLEITSGTAETVEMKELLTSETMTVDSLVLQKGWITLPLEADGIGEKMKAGKRYVAAVQFWTYLSADQLINRGNTFWLGSTKTFPASIDKQWTYQVNDGVWKKGSSFNKMIRLNINNHENRIDGVPSMDLLTSLEQNFPNPWSSETHIGYQLERSSEVLLEIRDITGKIIRVRNEGTKPAGRHVISVPKAGLEAGIYFYTLSAGGERATRRMVVG